MARTAALVSNRSEFAEERNPVALDSGFGVVLGETEIEVAFPVGGGESPHPRGKPVNEPRESQMTRAKDSKCGFARGPGWHAPIIKEATYLSDIWRSGGRGYADWEERKCPLPSVRFVGPKPTA